MKQENWRCGLSAGWSLMIIALSLSWFNLALSDVTLDGTMGQAGTLPGPDYRIPAEVGQQRGGNLFHSFVRFSIETKGSATFSGPASVDNVIGRVTGGVVSEIDGALRTDIPGGANVWLVNPAGVMFGEHARLDVQGSFHVSTADYLPLGKDGRFDATRTHNTLLTTSPPSAFGFLGSNPAPITVNGSDLAVPAGKTLSIVGGDVTVRGGNITAPGGRIDIASVASTGTVVPHSANDRADLSVDAFTELGEVKLSANTDVNAGGGGGGSIFIRGGRFVVESSGLGASARPQAGHPETNSSGKGIDIEITRDVVVDRGSQINANVLSSATQDTGGVRIVTKQLEVANDSSVNSVVLSGGVGNSGDIDIQADAITTKNNSLIRVSTGGEGDSGDINIITDTLNVRDGSFIGSLAFGGSGNAGDINIDAENILLSSDPASGFSQISSQTSVGTGNAGNLRINVRDLEIQENSEISSGTFSAGLGGIVDITANEITVTGFNDTFSGIFAGIFTNTLGSGRAGELNIFAEEIRLSKLGSFQSQTRGTGPGGSVRVTAKNLRLTEGGFIDASSSGDGTAGKISINAENVELRDGALLVSSGPGPAASGDIVITTGNLSMSGFESATDPFGVDATGISTITLDGRAGDIQINATGSVTLNSRAAISSASFGSGSGGSTDVSARSFAVLDGSAVLSSAFGSGDGGSIQITANHVLISGVHPEPFGTSPLISDAGGSALAISGVASQAFNGGGAAGDIRIRAENLKVLDGARVTTDTFGAGVGGTIDIVSDDVTISGLNNVLREFLLQGGFDSLNATAGAGATLSAESNRLFVGDIQILGEAATGDAGEIRIEANTISLSDHGRINTTTTGPAAGGDIALVANDVALSGNALITAESTSTGAAGSIEIVANKNVVNLDSFIAVRSGGQGNAGEILIRANDSFVGQNGAVTAESLQAAGGNIEIDAPNIQLIRTPITSSVRRGEGGGGNVTIEAINLVAVEGGDITARADQGFGGRITINAETFIRSEDVALDASSNVEGNEGVVQIDAVELDLNVDVPLRLPLTLLDVSNLVPTPCAQRLGSDVIQLVVKRYEALPESPYALRVHTPRLRKKTIDNGDTSSVNSPLVWSLPLQSVGDCLPREITQ